MSSRPRRLLVLGATGHIGQAVVRSALARADCVTAATRQTDPVALRGLAIATTHVDAECTNVTELAAGQDLIVDAAAPHPLDLSVRGSSAWRGVVDAAVTRTERVIAAARRHSLPLVFVSSFTTLPRHQSPVRSMEAAWRRSLYPYFEAKTAMERAVLDAARRGLHAVVVNPAACLGPWEFRPDGSSFIRMVLARRLPVVMDHTINVIDVRDVALAIELALSHQCTGRPIPLAGHDVSVPELAARIAALDGSAGRAPIGVNDRFASGIALWTNATFAAFGLQAPDLSRAVPLIADGFAMRPSPEQLAIGLVPRPLDDTLRDAIAFHRECAR